MSATRLVQSAIYAVLSADATLASLVTGGVHNDVPTGEAYPHVLIQGPTEMPAHTLGGRTVGIGWSNTVRLHVYSRYEGDLQAMQIHERIVALLNFQPLTVTGYSRVSIHCESARLMVEAVEKIQTRHLVSDWNVVTRQ